MKKAGIILVLFALMFSGCSEKKDCKKEHNQINDKTMEHQALKEIKLLLKTYETHLNASDAEAIVPLYTEDGMFMPTEAPTSKGAAQLLKGYQFVFDMIKLDVVFTVNEIVLAGDYAFAQTMSNGKTVIKATGDTVSESNRELFVFAKEDGAWRIARYMFNKTSPAQ